MGQAIVKCARDRDLYLIWSSQVDNAVAAFETRAELLAHLVDAGDTKTHATVRINRADRYGTSMVDCDWYGWDDERLRVMEGAPDLPDGPAGCWYIRRDRLVEYAEALLAAGEDDETVGHDLMEWQVWE